MPVAMEAVVDGEEEEAPAPPGDDERFDRGKAAVVAELLERQAADPATVTTSEHLEIPAGSTALSVAELKGHDDAAALLHH